MTRLELLDLTHLKKSMSSCTKNLPLAPLPFESDGVR